MLLNYNLKPVLLLKAYDLNYCYLLFVCKSKLPPFRSSLEGISFKFHVKLFKQMSKVLCICLNGLL